MKATKLATLASPGLSPRGLRKDLRYAKAERGGPTLRRDAERSTEGEGMTSSAVAARAMPDRTILRDLTFGSRVAEDEQDALASYFVETSQWEQIAAGDIDIVYGPEGSGKSAIYYLPLARKDEFFDRRIIPIPAENPRGTAAFRDLQGTPANDGTRVRGHVETLFRRLAWRYTC